MDYRRKDGSLFSGETLGVKVETEEGDLIGFLGVIRDITERLENERKIHALSKFPDENPGPVLRTDLTGRLLYANPASVPLLHQWQVSVTDNGCGMDADTQRHMFEPFTPPRAKGAAPVWGWPVFTVQ